MTLRFQHLLAFTVATALAFGCSGRNKTPGDIPTQNRDAGNVPFMPQDGGVGPDDEVLADGGPTDTAADAGPDGSTPTEDMAVPPIGTDDVFFHGDWILNDRYEVGFYDGDGRAAMRLTMGGLDGTAVRDVAVSPDGSNIVVSGHAADSTSDSIMRFDATDLATPTMITATNGTVEIEKISISPDTSHVAFIADIETDGVPALYVVPSDGSAAPRRLGPLPTTGGAVTNFIWVASDRLAFTGDLFNDEEHALWSVAAAGGAAVNLSGPIEVPAGPLGVDYSGRVYFCGHSATGEHMYRVYQDGSTRQQVPGTTVFTDGAYESDISGWALSPDGRDLAFTAEMENGVAQVFVLDVTESVARQVTSFPTNDAPEDRRFGPAPGSSLVWHPERPMLAVIADWTDDSELDDVYSVFLVNTDTRASVRLVSPPSVAQDVIDVTFTTDGTELVILGDLMRDGDVEMYATSDFMRAEQIPEDLRVARTPADGSISCLRPVPIP